MTDTGGELPKSPNRVLSGNLGRTLFVLAFPVLCEQLLSFCVALYDTWLSGRISAEATTAIGLGAYVSWLASMIFALVGTGTTALVARYWGAERFDEAGRVTNRSISLAALMGVLFYSVVAMAAPGLARLLGMSEETAAIAVRYVRIDGLGYMLYSVLLVGAAALRGSGDMRTPMWILGVVNLVNISVSTVAVFGLGPPLGFEREWLSPLGIDGIAVGTVTARFTGGLLMLWVPFRGRRGLTLSLKEMRIRGAIVRRILAIGAPAAVDGAVMWFGQFVYLMVIAHLAEGAKGDAIFAAHIVAIRVEAISYLPAVAWGQAAATTIGQSLGAGELARARRAGHIATLQCAIPIAIVSFLFYFHADAIYELMHESPLVRTEGEAAFPMLAVFQVPLVAGIIYVASLRGSGDTRFPMWATVISVLGVRLPVGWFCGIVLEGGLLGAWIGMCADIVLRAAIVAIRYARGRWVSSLKE